MADEKPYKLDLGANGKFEFATAEELTKWMEDECEFWTFVNASQAHVWNQYSKLRSRIHHSLVDVPLDASKWANVQRQIADSYGRLVHRDSPKGQLVCDVRARHGDPVAASALAFVLRLDNSNPPSPHAWHGAFLAALYEHGIAHDLTGPAKAFDDLHKTIHEWFTSAKDQIRSDLEAAANTRKELAGALPTVLASLEAIRSEHKGGVDLLTAHVSDAVSHFEGTLEEMRKANADKMTAIEKTYEEKLALHEAVDYWRNKKKSHQERADMNFIRFGLSLVGGLLALVLLTWWLLPQETAWDKIPLGRLVIVGAVVTAVLWVIRTFARLYFSNVHLATDAEEREVMVTTYLALLKEQAGLKDDTDRKLVIEALFRRASTGIVKSDAEPPNIVATILNKTKDQA